MPRLKTLSFSLFSALLATSGSFLYGQVTIALNTQKLFRQHQTGTEFRAGEFRVDVDDGIGVYLSGCEDTEYFPPSIPCPDGATAFVGFGNPDPLRPYAGPYFMQTGISPAIIIEPRREDRVFLRAAPASKLPRPLPGFSDTSYSIYYNISPGSISIKEYTVSRYRYQRQYTGLAGGRVMDSEIVPGVYHFSFPRLDYPTLEVALPSVHYPIPEGYKKIGKVNQGVRFTSPSQFSNGFAVIDKNTVPTIQWQGFARNMVYPGVDQLYFSIRHLVNPASPRSTTDYIDDEGLPTSIFPDITSGADPRVLLANPLVSKFTLPPFIDSGTRGVIELELTRSISTNGVAYDVSNRRYQLPVAFVDRYSEYKKKSFGTNTTRTNLFQDYDRDGFNNLTEWVTESRAQDSTSFPGLLPQPQILELEDFDTLPAADVPPLPTRFYYYGIIVNKRLGLIPGTVPPKRVQYFIQRSTNDGQTWSNVTTDANWTVFESPTQLVMFLNTRNSSVLPPSAVGNYYRIGAGLTAP
jgi:hypothetical protein